MLAALRPARVYEHLGVGTAGPGYARGAPPVVLFGKIEYPVPGYAALLPKGGAFRVSRAVIVALEDAYGKLVYVYFKHFGEKLVAPLYHFLLEKVAKRPVSQHLEKGAVRGVAHFVDVARPYAYLYVGKTLARRMLRAEKIGHKRMHARRGEQYGRIVFGYKRRRGYYRVSPFLKEV